MYIKLPKSRSISHCNEGRDIVAIYCFCIAVVLLYARCLLGIASEKVPVLQSAQPPLPSGIVPAAQDAVPSTKSPPACKGENPDSEKTPTTRGMALHARVTEDGYFFVGVDGMDNFSTPPGSPDPGPPPNMKWRRRRLGRNNNNDKNYVWEKDRFPLSRDFGACEAIVERRLNILPPEQHVEHIKCGFYCVQIVKCLLDAGNNWENVEPLPKDNRLTDAPDLCELLNSSQVLRKSPKRAFFTRISRNGGIMKTVYHEDKTKAEAEAVNDLGENLEVNMPDSIASYRPYHKIGRPLLDILADSSMENPLICSITDDTPNGFQGHWIVVAGSLPKNIDNERMETFYKVYDPLRGPLFCDIAASDFFRCYDSVFVHSAGDHALRKKLKNERGNASEVKLQKFTLNPGIETLVFLR